MIEGEKIIYIHKATGQMIEHNYIKEKINSDDEPLYTSDFKIIISSIPRSKRIDCVDNINYYDYEKYTYYVKDIPFSDDFDTVIINEDINWYDYRRVVDDVKLFNRGTVDFYLLSRLKRKENELRDIEVKYGITF